MSRAGRARRRTAFPLVAVGVLLVVFSVPLLSGCGAGHRLLPEAGAGGKGPAASSPASGSRVYPLSVIPGGAYSVEALQQSAETDPVVQRALAEMAAHTGDPRLLEHLRATQARQDTTMHTQLRDGDELYWSRGRVTVRKGETVFVHEPTGTPVIRARCGNGLWPVVPAGAPTRVAPPEPQTSQQPAPLETSAPEQKPVATKTPGPDPQPPQGAAETVRTLTEPKPSLLLSELPPGNSEPPLGASGAEDGLPPDEALPVATPPVTMAVGSGPTWDATSLATPNPVPATSAGLTWLPGALVLLPLVLSDDGSPSDGPPDPEPPPTPELSSSVLTILSLPVGYALLRLSQRRRRTTRPRP